MKIALVEWWPRICGSVNWGYHFYAGGRSVRGCDIDLITFSKSGKVLKSWHLQHPWWKVHRVSDAVDVLNSYNFIVLIDLVCFAPEVTARNDQPPWYAIVMNRVKTPWTAMYHGGSYPGKHDATIKTILSSRSFCQRLITTRIDQAIERLSPFGIDRSAIYHNPYLPFDETIVYRNDRSDHAPKNPRIKMTSRLMTNKGHFAMMYAFRRLMTSVDLHGYNAFGLPSIGWLLYELGRALGYRVLKEPVLRRDKQGLTHPRARKFYTGAFSFTRSRYRFNYLDAYDWDSIGRINLKGNVHLSLSNDAFGDTPEYVTLEAIAGGAVAIVANHSIIGVRYHGRGIETIPYTRGGARVKNNGEVMAKIVWDEDRFVKILNDLTSSTDLKEINDDQKRFVLPKHNARLVFKRVIENVT